MRRQASFSPTGSSQIKPRLCRHLHDVFFLFSHRSDIRDAVLRPKYQWPVPTRCGARWPKKRKRNLRYPKIVNLFATEHIIVPITTMVITPAVVIMHIDLVGHIVDANRPSLSHTIGAYGKERHAVARLSRSTELVLALLAHRACITNVRAPLKRATALDSSSNSRALVLIVTCRTSCKHTWWNTCEHDHNMIRCMAREWHAWH